MAKFPVKVKERFKALFPSVNLSNKKLDAIADNLDVENEEGIDPALNLINSVTPFTEIAKEEDKIRNLESAAKKKETEQKKDSKKDDTDDQPTDATPEGTPDWAKPLFSGMQQLSTVVSTIVAGTTAKGRSEKIADLYKDAPKGELDKELKRFGRMSFKDDADFDAYLEELKPEIEKLGTSTQDEGMSNPFGIPAPTVSTTTTKGGEKSNPGFDNYIKAKTEKPGTNPAQIVGKQL